MLFHHCCSGRVPRGRAPAGGQLEALPLPRLCGGQVLLWFLGPVGRRNASVWTPGQLKPKGFWPWPQLEQRQQPPGVPQVCQSSLLCSHCSPSEQEQDNQHPWVRGERGPIPRGLCALTMRPGLPALPRPQCRGEPGGEGNSGKTKGAVSRQHTGRTRACLQLGPRSPCPAQLSVAGQGPTASCMRGRAPSPRGKPFTGETAFRLTP